MKTRLFILYFIFSISIAFAQSISVEEIRNLYPKSVSDFKVCQSLYKRLEKTDKYENSILAGYYGAVATNMANHIKEPAKKIKYFNLGRNLIEKAIQMDSTNIELRFIRFTIQAGCPKGLHYNSSLTVDKSMLMNYIKDRSESDLKRKMIAYIASSKDFTPEEKSKLKN